MPMHLALLHTVAHTVTAMQATTIRPARRKVDALRWMTDILFGWTGTALMHTISNTSRMADAAAHPPGLRIQSRDLVSILIPEETLDPCSGYVLRLLQLWRSSGRLCWLCWVLVVNCLGVKGLWRVASTN